jgi:hypothetical protein
MAAFAACIVIGWAIAASWPGKFSPTFWVVLAVIDLVPAGMLGLFLLLMSRLSSRQVENTSGAGIYRTVIGVQDDVFALAFPNHSPPGRETERF